MERLSSAKYRGEGLIGDAHDVVHRLLRRQRNARGLRVESHRPRTRAPRSIALLHVPRPNAPCGPELGDLLEEVVMDVPEERESRRELIDVETPRDAPFDIGESIGKREGEFLRRRRAGLANVISGDRDCIPLWGLRCSPLEAVDDEAERRLDRKAPRVLRHVLF